MSIEKFESIISREPALSQLNPILRSFGSQTRIVCL